MAARSAASTKSVSALCWVGLNIFQHGLQGGDLRRPFSNTLDSALVGGGQKPQMAFGHFLLLEPLLDLFQIFRLAVCHDFYLYKRLDRCQAGAYIGFG